MTLRALQGRLKKLFSNPIIFYMFVRFGLRCDQLSLWQRVEKRNIAVHVKRQQNVFQLAALLGLGAQV